MSKFDYSKWDNIELSDDDSDLHPNIDRDSWFRLKHRTRLEREAKEDETVEKYKKLNTEEEARLSILKARFDRIKRGEVDDDNEINDEEGLNGEINEIQTNINSRLKYIHDVQEKRKWTIDNICKVKEEKTVVSSQTSAPSLKAEDFAPTGETERRHKLDVKKESSFDGNVAATAKVDSSESVSKSSSTSTEKINQAPTTVVSREKFAVIAYNDYVLLHERTLEEYSDIQSLDDSKDYLFKHCDILLHEHAQSYMLLSCLEDEMNAKKERAKLVCRQSQILSHIHELGSSMKRDPRDVILPFFKRIEEAQYRKAFLEAVEDFHRRIQHRAIEKRKEMEQEELHRRERAMEVFESLPQSMKEAFESQDVDKLHEALAELNPEDAKRYMKECVDVGLWVPKDSDEFN